MAKLIVYIVFCADSFEDWRVDEVFSSAEKAQAYINSLKFSGNHFIISSEVK